ncbi:MAG: Xaa-Pro peptidase family protein, partial [Thaumarchaeota archaeon]|nr:Xaa-Pro peptidase family protein [Nitrososphaerota archaeon]
HEHLNSFVFAVFPKEKGVEPALILPSGEVADSLALNMTWFKDVRNYGNFFITIPEKGSLSDWEENVASKFRARADTDAFVVLKKVLEERGLTSKKIGFDEKGLKGDDYPKLLKTVSVKDPVDAFEIFREIRKIKNQEEVDIIREANAVTEKGIKSVLETIRVGCTGSELVKVFGETVAGRGILTFAPSISLGTESYLQYNYFPSMKRSMERGDLVRFDVICVFKYHYTDIGRNAVLGSPSARQKECYRAVFNGEEASISKLKPGAKSSEIFEAGVEAVRKSGLPKFQRNHCGHGIGLELYEHPLITPTSNDLIEEGCVLNIETPYYEIGNGGYMVEDTLLVTKSGVEFLTTLDRGLIEVSV